jgi:hypothetical protein
LDWKPVTSTLVRRAAFAGDGATGQLLVELDHGDDTAVYEYSAVDRGVFEKLIAADSVGGEFNTNVRNRFGFRRLSPAPRDTPLPADEAWTQTPTSSAVRRFAWMRDDAAAGPRVGDLFVEFAPTGRTYRYDGVPEQELQALRAANSVGGHLHRNIRNSYPFEQLRS